MRLESARSLKLQIVEEALTRVRTTKSGIVNVAIQKSVLPIEEPLPPLALGIERNDGDYRLAIRVQGITPGVQENIDQIVERAHGEASIRIVGRLVKQQTRSRVRPLLIGSSIGPSSIMAGTLGCFVRLDGVGTHILSNNHILAGENRATPGDPILQPSPFDRGLSPQDHVATLSRFEPLSIVGKNLVDAAVAALDEGIQGDLRTLTNLGELRGVRTVPLAGNEIVFKIGRTTGLTRGRISAFEVDDIWVRYDMGAIGFDRQIEIAPMDGVPFSVGGDSGSLILDEDFHAVGLLFAGNDVDVTYANPIQTVLQTLGAHLL